MGKRTRRRTERRRLRRKLEKEVERRGGTAFVSDRATVEHLKISLQGIHDCALCRELLEKGEDRSG